MSPKDSQSPVQPIESPSGLDLHPEPQKAVRISRRAGGAVICVIASVLLAFAYGGYRRSVKNEAAARRAGLPTTVAPATQAGTEFVSAVPLGNAPLAKAAELHPSPEYKGNVAAACGTDPRTGSPYRYNPQTGQPCEGVQQERVVSTTEPSPRSAQAIRTGTRANSGRTSGGPCLPARAGGSLSPDGHIGLEVARNTAVCRPRSQLRRSAATRRQPDPRAQPGSATSCRPQR